ncbi:deoxyguanosinetriphosphate triphosphohydrolase [Maritalea sp. S77]|uniref:deoxyguanosinetriphosphate triphosphohydrolase n=1 Tax=Maritalea sp. S77 TaxID=3415125 RepID=UPI003C7B6DFE
MSSQLNLASYAADPFNSLGRRYQADDSATRNEFQRDRDRIIHSNAFRRLKHKTQVFLHHEGNHYRTRLTHTLEVAQIARSIARSLKLCEDLAEALALAHDLGHTPFGHAGERVLHEKMHDLGGFDHNIQALRLVTRLENRYAEHDGLNLTWETLEGIIKHNGPLMDSAGKPTPKYQKEGLPGGLDEPWAVADLRYDSYASLEAQAAAIADDIAYNAHDIDDALRAGLLSLEELRDVPPVGPIVQEVQSKYPLVDQDRQTHEVVRRLLTRTIEDVIVDAKQRLVAADIETIEDVRQANQTLIGFSHEMATAEKGLKSFLFDRVYRHKSVMDQVDRAQHIVAKLFDAYLAGEELPGEWKERAKVIEKEKMPRLVSDFIAGMTDPYATTEYNRLFDADEDFR